MAAPKERRFNRIRLATPIAGQLGSTPVSVIDISALGARLEVSTLLAAGLVTNLEFPWEQHRIVLESKVVRSKVEKFRAGADGASLYHCGVFFTQTFGDSGEKLRDVIAQLLAGAMQEASGSVPQLAPMALARKTKVTGLSAQQAETLKRFPGAIIPASARVQAPPPESGYVTCRLDKSGWKKTKTEKADQPANGFTVSASEGEAEIDRLCQVWRDADKKGRELIQMFAELTITEAEGIPPG